MNTLIHADIFFFITTIWIVVISAIIAVILVYIAIIFNDLRHISRKVREGSENLADDLDEWRASVKAEGFKLQNIFKYFTHLFSKRKHHKK